MIRIMKTTIDIPRDELEEAIRYTGAHTMKEAVVTAIRELNQRHRLDALADRFGTVDGFPSREEILKGREEG